MNWTKRIVTVFGVGLIPKAPGTLGSLVALPLAFVLMQLGELYHMGFSLALTAFSILICESYLKQTDSQDPQEVVIDEVAGMLITMTWLPLTWQSFLLGFVIFRLLDILKPFPIGYLDRKVRGGAGVVLDDVAAGILANILLQLIYSQTSWLGAQL